MENDMSLENQTGFKYKLGQVLRKKSGSQWEGWVVGFYSTELTPEGYAIESSTHAGSVQIYPVSALEPALDLVPSSDGCNGCYYMFDDTPDCPYDEARGALSCSGDFIWKARP